MANSVSLTGYLAADPKTRTHGELRICDLRLAVQRRRGRDGADRGAFFIDVPTFNGQADACAKYLKKGSRIGIVGELDIEEYTKDGQRRWRPKVKYAQVEFLSRRPDTDAPQPKLAAVPDEQPAQAEPTGDAEHEPVAA